MGGPRLDSYLEANPSLFLLCLNKNLDLELIGPRYAMELQSAAPLVEPEVLLRVLFVAAALFMEAFQCFEVSRVEGFDKFSERPSGGRVRQLDRFVASRGVKRRARLRANWRQGLRIGRRRRQFSGQNE